MDPATSLRARDGQASQTTEPKMSAYGLQREGERLCPVDAALCELFQPDDQEPLRLLLVCPACGRWIVLAGFRRQEDGGITWPEVAHHFGPATVAVAS